MVENTRKSVGVNPLLRLNTENPHIYLFQSIQNSIDCIMQQNFEYRFSPMTKDYHSTISQESTELTASDFPTFTSVLLLPKQYFR